MTSCLRSTPAAEPLNQVCNNKLRASRITFIALPTLANFSVSCTLQKASLAKYSQLNITHFVGFCR